MKCDKQQRHPTSQRIHADYEKKSSISNALAGFRHIGEMHSDTDIAKLPPIKKPKCDSNQIHLKCE